MQVKEPKMQFLPNYALLLWNVYECSEISNNITKLTLHQQVTIVGYEGLKLITQQMD